MVDRKKPNEERELPDLNFVIKPNIRFSISTTPTLAYEFKKTCANNFETVSSLLTKFLFKKLNIKDIKDYEYLLKEHTKKLARVDRNEFSQYMKKEIEKYIKKNG